MCGILGITSNQTVAQELYDGLIVLQHRGQDSAGIMTYDGRFHLKKGNGLVRDVFHVNNMARLTGNMGIGHVRYPTAGGYDASEAQPFFVNSPFGIALIHNGNLTNYDELKEEVAQKNIRYLNTTSDSEILLNVLANEILDLRRKTLDANAIFKAMSNVYKRIKGSYAVIAIIAGIGMVAFRDPYGIRPLVYGKRSSSLLPEYMFSSESVALNTLGYDDEIKDIQPGQVIFVDNQKKLHSKQVVKKRWSPCIFEQVYLARPDSFIDDVSVYKARLRMGEALAKQIKRSKIEIDAVIPVPDSARPSAMALAQQLGVNYREGLVKNRYVGRTFIMPGQEIRKKSIKYKLNAIPLELRRRKILLVDDSIVRGNTSRKIVEMVRDAGAEKVYFASCAPPLIQPCPYGVDMPSKKDFVANGLSIKEIAKFIGVDKLFYQKPDDLIAAAKFGNPEVTDFCYACMGGKYPTKDITDEKLKSFENARCCSQIEDNEPEDIVEDQMSI
ncbi:amidophosphoribosyltransferase [Candidatus Peregrinibacteria bacterium]|nr:amidophosphoribosyltransferase [Candidatus Peregrinibacteria bacterium]